MEQDILQITVFDFSPEDCAQTTQIVRGYCQEQNFPVSISQFTKMQPFVLDFKQRCDAGHCYDMAFAGVDDIMGVEAARHIRGMDDLFPLFFVSRPENDYGMEAFRLLALHYMIKPVSAQEVEKGISRIMDRTYSGRRPAMLRGGESEWLDNLHPSPYKRKKEEQ